MCVCVLIRIYMHIYTFIKSENIPVKWECTVVPILEGAELTWLLTGCPSSERVSIS